MTRDYSSFLPTRARAAGPRATINPLQALGWQPFFVQQISADELTATPPVRVVELHRNGLHVLGESVDTTLPQFPFILPMSGRFIVSIIDGMPILART